VLGGVRWFGCGWWVVGGGSEVELAAGPSNDAQSLGPPNVAPTTHKREPSWAQHSACLSARVNQHAHALIEPCITECLQRAGGSGRVPGQMTSACNVYLGVDTGKAPALQRHLSPVVDVSSSHRCAEGGIRRMEQSQATVI
jgi:hypothetical protein